jgi:hypothetical protein
MNNKYAQLNQVSKQIPFLAIKNQNKKLSKQKIIIKYHAGIFRFM